MLQAIIGSMKNVVQSDGIYNKTPLTFIALSWHMTKPFMIHAKHAFHTEGNQLHFPETKNEPSILFL